MILDWRVEEVEGFGSGIQDAEGFNLKSKILGGLDERTE
jgi:hypothetical protein